ncbi:MAG TPA: hypothetical protein VNA13_03980 [Xanthomonadales bacterium]|nr:hypothetical protein [Xanthomonadales bacterium]
MIEAITAKQHDPSWTGELGGTPSTERFNEPLKSAHLVQIAAIELGLKVAREAGEGGVYVAATWKDSHPVQRRVPVGQIRLCVDFSDNPDARPNFRKRLMELRAESNSIKSA